MDINYWMSANRLKLNMDKTELLSALGWYEALPLQLAASHPIPCTLEGLSSQQVNMLECLG